MSGADLSKAYQALALVPEEKPAYPVNLAPLSKSAHPNLSVGLVGLYILQQYWVSHHDDICCLCGLCRRSRPPEIEPPTETGWSSKLPSTRVTSLGNSTRLYQWTKSSSSLDQALRHPTFLPLLREKNEKAPQWYHCLLYFTQMFTHVQHPNFRFHTQVGLIQLN